MTGLDPIGLRVEHNRTGAQGTVVGTNGRGQAVTCTVEFEHATEEVPQALLRPLVEPFELLRKPRVGYPYWRWLQRERFRLLDAYKNDLALGLSNSRVDPQLHQVSVALRALEKSQARLILADEVGLGKTIEAGLVLKELRARMGSALERVLIIVPASLVSQWQYELRSKFNEHFVLLDGPPGWTSMPRRSLLHPGIS
jgi:SNF2 family DNA or RNA helicase